MLITFVTILAWIGAIVGTLISFAGMYLENQYNQPDSLDRMLDKIEGGRTEYHYGKYIIIAIVSWAWVITTLVVN